MKLHIGADAVTFFATTAHVHDVTQAHRLLHGEEARVWGDAGCGGTEAGREPGAGGGVAVVALKPGQRRKLAPGSLEAQVEKVKASIRAKVEHPFLDVKQRFIAKVRYRGLAKNTERIALLLGLSNLTTAQRAVRLIRAQWPQ